jgi:hypothetical protein
VPFDVLHCHHNRLSDPTDFDHRIGFFLAAAVGHVDDFSLQEIFAMKLHENLRWFRDVSVANSKMDPGVSHFYFGLIFTELLLSRLFGTSKSLTRAKVAKETHSLAKLRGELTVLLNLLSGGAL